MNLDIQTILVVLLANVCATAIALPLLMGWRVSRAARYFQMAVIVHAVSWAFFLLAPFWNTRATMAVSMGTLALSFTLFWMASHAWLGPRPGKWVMWLLVPVITVVNYWSYPHYPTRLGATNGLLAIQLVLTCVMLAWPSPQGRQRWRWLVFACAAALSVATAWRAVLGAFFTDAYPFYAAPHPVNVAAVLLYHVALALVTLGMLAAWREEAERDLRRQAQTDGLTNLPNRQAFLERAYFSLAQAVRYDEPMSVVMIDLDHFKQINDQHGHAAGDTALKTLAEGLRACTRAGDLTCRYGGEEFCVLLMRSEMGDARHFDQRLRGWLLAHARKTGTPLINYSAGVAPRLSDDRNVDEMIQRADIALYDAKAQGRGRLAESGATQTRPMDVGAAAAMPA